MTSCSVFKWGAGCSQVICCSGARWAPGGKNIALCVFFLSVLLLLFSSHLAVLLNCFYPNPRVLLFPSDSPPHPTGEKGGGEVREQPCGSLLPAGAKPQWCTDSSVDFSGSIHSTQSRADTSISCKGKALHFLQRLLLYSKTFQIRFTIVSALSLQLFGCFMF